MRAGSAFGWALLGAAALGGFATAAPARAAGKQVDQITCEEFLALDESDRSKIAFWVDGYQVAKGEAAVGTVAFDEFGQPVGALVEGCKATPRATLWEKLEKHP